MIYDKDTNFVYLSDKLQEWYPDTFNRLTRKLDAMGIKWGELCHTCDIWARDYMPLQLSENDFLLYQYRPDYLANENACIAAMSFKSPELSKANAFAIKTFNLR